MTAWDKSWRPASAYLYTVAGAKRDLALQAKAGASDLVQDTFWRPNGISISFTAFPRRNYWRGWRSSTQQHGAFHGRSYRRAAKRLLTGEVRLGSDTPLRFDRKCCRQRPFPGVVWPSPKSRLKNCKWLWIACPMTIAGFYLASYQEQQPFEEIAEKMARSANTVRKLWMRRGRLAGRDARGAMNEADADPDEEHVASFPDEEHVASSSAACDDALAGGKPPPPLAQSDVPWNCVSESRTTCLACNYCGISCPASQRPSLSLPQRTALGELILAVRPSGWGDSVSSANWAAAASASSC